MININHKSMFSFRSKILILTNSLLILSLFLWPGLVSAKTIDIGSSLDTVRVQGQLLNTYLSAAGNRCLYVDSSGNILAKASDCGTATGGDDLGSHSATQNIRLNTYWLSGDGGSEGIYIGSTGNVGIGTNNPGAYQLYVNGGGYFSSPITTITPTSDEQVATKGYADSSFIDWSRLGAFPAACSAGQYVTAVGSSLTCSTPAAGTDIYWTGTATNLDANTGRTSLGLGSLATLSAVTSAYITNDTIVDADINSSASISASKIQYGSYFIDSAGTNNQVWTSDGAGAGYWNTFSAGGVSGSGSLNYISKWTGASSQGNSLLYDNGISLGLGNTSPGARLQINAGSGEALRLVTNAVFSPLNIRNSADSADIFRVDQTGSLAVGIIPKDRVTGLGALAELDFVNSSEIKDDGIMDIDINASANISASKIQYGSYFINSAGSNGQVWTSDGSGAGYWTASGSGSIPAGTTGSTLKYSGSVWESSINLINDGSLVKINWPFGNNCSTSTELIVNGQIQSPGVYFTYPLQAFCGPGALIEFNNTTERLEFSGSDYNFLNGNVGIGVAPLAKLHVAGDIYSTANIRGSFRSSDNSAGVSVTYYLDDCAGANCSMTVKNGIITASTCRTTSCP